MLGEQLLRIVSGLFVSIMVARYLGPKNFGLFNYVLAYIAIFSGIARLGLDDILVRELISAPERILPWDSILAEDCCYVDYHNNNLGNFTIYHS